MCAAENGATDLFLPARLRVLTEDGRVRAIKRVLVQLPRNIEGNILKQGVLRNISICAVDLLAATLAFARAEEIDWIVSDCWSRFLYDFADVTIILESERQSRNSESGLPRSALHRYRKCRVCLSLC